jgi:hypothetical protein
LTECKVTKPTKAVFSGVLQSSGFNMDAGIGPAGDRGEQPAGAGADRVQEDGGVENDTGEEVVAESLSMSQTANLPSGLAANLPELLTANLPLAMSLRPAPTSGIPRTPYAEGRA